MRLALLYHTFEAHRNRCPEESLSLLDCLFSPQVNFGKDWLTQASAISPRVYGERSMSTPLRQLGFCATRFRTAKTSSRHISKLARLKNSPFQCFPYARVSLPPSQLRKAPLSWSPVRSYSSPSGSSNTATSIPTNPSSASGPKEQPAERPPSYELTFTCKPCKHRSTHTITKQGYHYGAVLITCPECKNRHVISDHLGIFADQAFTVEDLMKQKGDLVKRGTLSGQGDLEFWDDGTETERMKDAEANQDRST